MKKAIYIVVYWMAAIFLTSLLLTSLDYDLGEAVLMSLSFLPASLALCFFLPIVERDKDGKKRILNTIYVILGVMVMTFLLIFVWQLVFITLIYQEDHDRWTLPAMLGNPVFVGFILSILAYGNYRLVNWLDKKYPTDRPISFTSDYKKVSLRKEDILYVESRDSEVWAPVSFASIGLSWSTFPMLSSPLPMSFPSVGRRFPFPVNTRNLSKPPCDHQRSKKFGFIAHLGGRLLFFGRRLPHRGGIFFENIRQDSKAFELSENRLFQS